MGNFQQYQKMNITFKIKCSIPEAPTIRGNAGPKDAVAGFGTSVEFSCSVGRVMLDDVRWLHNAKKIDTDTDPKYSLSGKNQWCC